MNTNKQTNKMRIRLPNAKLWRCGYSDFAAAAAKRPIFFCFMLDLLRKFCCCRRKKNLLYFDTAAVKCNWIKQTNKQNIVSLFLITSNMLEVIKNRDTMFCLFVWFSYTFGPKVATIFTNNKVNIMNLIYISINF